MAPRATYRLQFHAGFGFDDAAAIVPYLARLGVSHVYASPFFRAHPGSTHGYDVVDYGELNPELGGQAAFDRLSAALAAHDLKLLLDFVPNHMGVGGSDNAFWLDLLEWGEEADHAGWFDIDWSSDRTDIRGKVLVPFLGDQYGAVLANGGLELRFDPDHGTLAVWAHGTHKLPVSPLDYEFVLGPHDRRLAEIGDAFADLMRWRPQVMRRARRLKADLAEAAQQPGIRAAIDRRIACFTGRKGDLGSWSTLAALIERQNWKPTFYKVASDDINYRRFFNIATLAGLRMELPALFDNAHQLVFKMMHQGTLDGLRIDHIDGLFDPKGYLERLRRDGPTPDGEPFYLVVEKILGPDEPLRAEWPVQGTTGYDFTNLLTGFFVDHAAEAAFTRAYLEFTGEGRSFEAMIFDAKLQIIDNEMRSELHRLARAATRVARQNPMTVDLTLTVLQRALRLLVASFPVYRTYVNGEQEPTARDWADLDRALASAATIDRVIDASVFAFLRRLLSGDLAHEPELGYRRSDVLRCAMKFQQYCGPVMAKGVEDTAFYRYYRFVALNEVGGAPDRFGISMTHFHDANAVRARDWPDSMLATSTHDTKRGEDTRARLAALSSIPEAWSEAVARWDTLLQPALNSPDRPDRNDRYLLYQLLVGTWPIALMGDGALDEDALDEYRQRMHSVMEKSMREAKRHSTWTAPEEAYENATMALVDAALAPSSGFLPAFRPFAADVARRGASNTFAQTVLKLTVPGMPDTYQGTEAWDLTMVDPDNRRPIDYASRQAMLDRCVTAAAGQLTKAWTDWSDGAFKVAITHAFLELRQQDPRLFARGSYEPLHLEGSGADAFCAFLRRNGTTTLLVVACRYPGTIADPTLVLPLQASEGDRPARDVLRGLTATAGLPGTVAAALGDLPASVWLVRD